MMVTVLLLLRLIGWDGGVSTCGGCWFLVLVHDGGGIVVVEGGVVGVLFFGVNA